MFTFFPFHLYTWKNPNSSTRLRFQVYNPLTRSSQGWKTVLLSPIKVMFFFTYISLPIFPYENSSHQLSRQERKHASFSILIPIMPNKRSYSAQRNSDLLHAKASSTTRQIIKAIPKASFSFSFFFLLFISTTTTYVQIHQPNAGNYRKKIHV